MFKVVCVFVLCIFMFGCQVPFPSNDAKAYLKSKNGPKLVVPPPLKHDEISSFYFLPEACGNKRVHIHP